MNRSDRSRAEVCRAMVPGIGVTMADCSTRAPSDGTGGSSGTGVRGSGMAGTGIAGWRGATPTSNRDAGAVAGPGGHAGLSAGPTGCGGSAGAMGLAGAGGSMREAGSEPMGSSGRLLFGAWPQPANGLEQMELHSAKSRRDPDSSPGADDFSAVYAAWSAGVLRWTKALGVGSDDKFDVVQNVFVIVHRRLPYCDRRNLAGWLYRITTRQVRDYLRQRWNRVLSEAVPISLEMPSGAPTPATVLERRQDQEVLTGILSRLSDPVRSTFVLFEIYGFTCTEIAAQHHVPTTTVWARLRRGRRKVFALLTERQTEEDAASHPSGSEAALGKSLPALSPVTSQY